MYKKKLHVSMIYTNIYNDWKADYHGHMF